MLNEGMYAVQVYNEMKEMVGASVKELMDSGYTMDEACGECNSSYRMDGVLLTMANIFVNATKQQKTTWMNVVASTSSLKKSN